MASTRILTASSLDGRFGCEAALVADGGRQAAIVQHRLERVIGLGAPAQGLANDAAPSGTIMNSCKSTLLSAWAPPLMTFIIGTGKRWALAPPT